MLTVRGTASSAACGGYVTTPVQTWFEPDGRKKHKIGLYSLNAENVPSVGVSFDLRHRYVVGATALNDS